MKSFRILSAAVIALLLLTLIACGGGGGGPVINWTSLRVEAILTATGATVDPTNILATDGVTFRITGVDSNNSAAGRQNVGATGWVLTGDSGGSISLSGVFTVAAPTGNSGVVSIVYGGLTYATTARVVAVQAIVSGRCRTTTNIPGSRITFQALNSSLAVVATGMVATDGTIRASVPTSATKFTLSFQAVDPSGIFYARQFLYATLDYSTIISGCVASMPALANGSISNLGTDVVVYAFDPQNPPPPPTGCN